MYAVGLFKPGVVTVVSLCIKGKLFYSLRLYNWVSDLPNIKGIFGHLWRSIFELLFCQKKILLSGRVGYVLGG